MTVTVATRKRRGTGETARAAGIRFERKVGAALRDDGYRTNRGAGSKGFADFVAVKPGQQLFVACKLTGIISAAEWDALYETASWVGAVPVLAVNGPAGRGVDYWRLLGRRVRRAPMGRQPAERFHTDVVLPTADEAWQNEYGPRWAELRRGLQMALEAPGGSRRTRRGALSRPEGISGPGTGNGEPAP